MSYNPVNPNGQAVMASSSPVVLASNHSDIKITLDGETIAISGTVDISGSSSVGVTGTFWQATQPVSITQDIMLGTDFSDVFGTGTLLTTTQADNILNTTDTFNTSAFGYWFDGSAWDRARGDSTDGLLVNLGGNNDVTVTGTVTASIAAAQTLATVTTVGTVTTITNVVHIDDNSGNISIDDGGNVITVDGTVAITNASLTTLAGAIYTEDLASQNLDPGIQVLTVRKNTAASTSGADGDYQPFITNTTGHLWVDASGQTLTVGSHAVTNAGTFAVQVDGAALTSLQLSDDVVYTDDTSTHATGTSKGTGIMAVANPTDAAVDANDIGMVAMTLARALKNDITTIAGTAPTTAGFIDIKGADGNIFVRQTTASNLNATVVGTGTFVTQSTLAAETTKVIGVVRTSDGAGNLLTSNSTTYTAKFALDGNLLGTLGTAFTTAGFVDIKGADGNVFVRQATAGNLNMTEASAASILTSVQLTDDMIYTDDTSTHSTGVSKGALIMAAATPTDTAVNANDIGALAMTLNRELLVQVNTALPAGTNGIGKLTANSGVTIGAVEIAAAQTLATVTTVSTVTAVTNVATIGTSVTPGTAAANLGKAEDAIAGSGDTGVFMLQVANEAQSSLAADGDYIASSADIKGNTMMVGNIAHDGVNAGNPILNGYEAIAHGTNPTAVAAADRTKGYANRAGIPFVIGGHPNIVSVEYITTGAQTDDDLLGAIGTGTKVVITSITAVCSAANTVQPSIRVGFGTANVPTQGASGASGTSKMVLSHPACPAGSGITKGNGSGIVGIGGDGEELRLTCTAPTTGSLVLQIDYYTIES